MSIAGAFAIFHGYAHGAEAPATASGLTYVAGFVISTALLHAAGLGAGLALKRAPEREGGVMARLAGGALALGGVGLLVGWM